MSALVIRVNPSNEDRPEEIQELLRNKQNEDREIDSIIYDKNSNVVRVSGTFNPIELRRALLAKLRDKINGIDIIQEPPKEPPKEEPKPKPPKQPMYPWPPQVTMVCFVCPCPCKTAWANNYRCCSCVVDRWPGRCKCGSGSGSRWGSGPRHGDRPQWGCESSQQPNIGYESMPSIGYESMPTIGYESTEPSCSIM